MRQAPSSSTTDRRSRPRTSAILGLRACEPPPETSGLAESAIGAELIPHDPGGLQYHAPEECRIVPQVPAPQASRLCPQPEEPLKPAPLHPAGSSLLDSCVKVERRPDTDQHGSSETAQVSIHPTLLLRRAEPDPDDIGIGIVDLLDDRLIFRIADRPKRRAVGACNSHSGVSATNPLRQPPCAPLPTSIEEMAIALDDGALAAGQHQVRPAHLLDVRMTIEPAEPDQGHAVRSHQAGTVVNRPESLVPLTLHDPVHACNADVLRLPLSNPALDRLERLSHVDCAHPDAEDVDSLHPARRSCRVTASTGSAMRRVPPPYLATYWS